MRRDKLFGLLAGGLLLVTALVSALGLAVMLLWNWLMPDIFGLPTVSWLQATGLLVLCHLLFKLGAGSGKNLGDTIRQSQRKGAETAPVPPAATPDPAEE